VLIGSHYNNKVYDMDRVLAGSSMCIKTICVLDSTLVITYLGRGSGFNPYNTANLLRWEA